MGKSKDESGHEMQALLLWAILAEGGGKEVPRPKLKEKKMLPSDDSSPRNALKRASLITCAPRPGEGSRLWYSVTRDGLAWAENNLATPLPTKSTAGSAILRAWLTRLSSYMQANNLSLDNFLGLQDGDGDPEPRPEPPPQPSPPPDYAALRARIRQAYLDLTGGRLNTRALLADIRAKLADVDRASLDDALKRMQREEEASLYQLDNKAELTDADRAAAIYFGGDPRHILWIER